MMLHCCVAKLKRFRADSGRGHQQGWNFRNHAPNKSCDWQPMHYEKRATSLVLESLEDTSKGLEGSKYGTTLSAIDMIRAKALSRPRIVAELRPGPPKPPLHKTLKTLVGPALSVTWSQHVSNMSQHGSTRRLRLQAAAAQVHLGSIHYQSNMINMILTGAHS